MKGKALRRALSTADVIRVGADIPLITDVTELITPAVAEVMLTRNKNNRPIKWEAVDRYAGMMSRGEWQLHAQGIVLDGDGNILTGQNRLWAVVLSGVSVYMRVSRGNPPESALVLDRGVPQSSRDLATRQTSRKHSPTEASIVRAYCALMGNTRPSTDQIAIVLAVESDALAFIMRECRVRKTRSVLLILGAILGAGLRDLERLRSVLAAVALMAGELESTLAPTTPTQCWGRGAAFSLAMERAREIVARQLQVGL